MMAVSDAADTAAHWSLEQWEAMFMPEAPERIALVAIKQAATSGQAPAKVAGFILALCVLDEWEIESVAVDVELRRQGVGRALMGELLKWAQGQSVTSVLLEVGEYNVAAQRLYEKFGFSQDGSRSNYYRGPYEKALLMRLRLQICDKTP